MSIFLVYRLYCSVSPMPGDIDLSLILPAYNECASIASTIDQAFAYFQSRGIRSEIIVAADGNDGTRELAREKSCGNPYLTVIGHEERSGKGRGVREAVELTRGRFIGYADADNKVPITEYDKIHPFLQQGFEVVTGSRGLDESQIERRQPWYRRFGSKGFRLFLQVVLGLPGVRDTQCGFKFFQREIALELFRLQQIDGYMFDVEILTLAHRAGYRIKEVPIRWHDDADSRLQLLSGNIQNVRDILAIRASLAHLQERRTAIAVAAAGED
jgi:dolichyl-phosphate beta-glucosyltransferase